MPATRKPAPRPATKPSVEVGPGSDEDFTFTSSAGEITVPSLAVAPTPNRIKLLRAAAEKNDALQSLLMLEAAAGPEAMDLIEALSPDEQDEFLEAWTNHSGVRLGESRA